MSNYVKGANHINIRPSHAHYDETIIFYCNDLGLKMTNFWTKMRGSFESRNCFIDCGNSTTIEVCECENGTEKAGIIQHFALDVYDANKTFEMLRDKGYAIVNSKGEETEEGPIEVKLGNPEIHLRLFFVKSPSSEIVEFVETL